MTLGLEVWVPLGLAAILAAFTAAKLLRMDARDLDQTVLLLRPVDVGAIGKLLGPEQEAIMRRTLSARAYAEAQPMRMKLLSEYLRRISHNSTELLRWAESEKARSSQRHPGQQTPSDKLILFVMSSSTAIRRHALYAIFKMAIWRGLNLAKFRIMPSLSLSDLREWNGGDILAIYEELTSAAAEVVLAIRPDMYEQFLAAL